MAAGRTYAGCIAAVLALSICLPMLMVVCGCSGGTSAPGSDADTVRYMPDTLRVATLYSPTSYFIYRGEPMGYDFSLVSDLAETKGMQLDLHVAPSMQAAIAMLDSGAVDLIAYEVPVTAEYKSRVLACGPENITTQVLVQPKNDSERITDVTQLVGQDVYVTEDSKYSHRLENLNSELGGGINIHPVDRDTMITEDLIAMVSRGEIPLTVVDSDIARINKTYFPDLDITLPLSLEQRSRWAVNPKDKWLADSIDAWLSTDEPRQRNALLLKRYFELSKDAPGWNMNFNFTGGRISQYDDLFRRYAPDINWDWRLLASQCFVESRFDVNVESWVGARGLMQIMPATARSFGASSAALDDPDTSVKVASRIIASLDRSLQAKVPDCKERVKFVLAAYNSGLAHVLDAIALAGKTGRNPQIWSGNVEEALMLKSNPKYFNDPVCKYGYFRGRETVDYVKRVMEFYNRATARVRA